MMKMSSKRRRTKKQIAEEKLAKEQHEAEIAAKLAQLAAAEEKLADFDEMQRNYDNAHAIMTQLRD